MTAEQASQLQAAIAGPYPADAPRFRLAIYSMARQFGVESDEAVEYAIMPPEHC